MTVKKVKQRRERRVREVYIKYIIEFCSNLTYYLLLVSFQIKAQIKASVKKQTII